MKMNKALLAYLAVCFFWGSTYLAIRIGVKDMPPFVFAGIRFVVAGSLLLVFSKLRGYSFPKEPRQIFKYALVGLLLILGGNGLVVFAQQWVPSGIASLVIATVPLFIAIIEIFVLKLSKMSLVGYLGLLMGFAGVAYLALSKNMGGDVTVFSILLLVMASFSWSIGSVFSKTIKSTSDMLPHIGIQMLAGGVGQLLVSLLRQEYLVMTISWSSVYAMMYLIIFGSIVGYSSYIYVLQHWPASRVGTYAYVNPVVAVILGALILKEPITPQIVGALVIILLGVILVQKSKITLKKV